MRSIRLTFLALAALAAAGGAFAAAPDANSARAFLQKIYAHYPAPAANPGAFDPTGAQAPDLFDAGMVALFREDTKLAKGEVGAIDADPLCQCQDDGGMTVRIHPATMQGAAAATAVVDLLFVGGKPNPLTIHLVVVKGQWRIGDLSTTDMPSWRAYLVHENKEHAAGRW